VKGVSGGGKKGGEQKKGEGKKRERKGVRLKPSSLSCWPSFPMEEREGDPGKVERKEGEGGEKKKNLS